MKKKLKSAMLVAAMSVPLLFVSCEENNNGGNNENVSKILQEQLLEDYSQYALTDITWKKQQGYDVASFAASTKSSPMTMNAWYQIQENKPERLMDSKNLGANIPEIIKPAFDATVYSNTALWTVEEVELEQDFVGNTAVSTYEVELQSVENPNLEAELIFDSTSGELLFTTEDLDEDDNDDNESFFVNEELKIAVLAKYPTATIINAEFEDNIIEVNLIVEINKVRTEIEMFFSPTYDYIGEEFETNYTYATMPSEFSTVVGGWYAAHPKYPAPVGTDIVVISTEFTVGLYFYDVEIEYVSNNVKYEAEFALNDDYVIIGDPSVEIDD